MKVTTDISLSASPEAIWAVLTDLASYTEWNPMIKAASGMPAPMGRIEVTISYLGADLLKGSAEVTGLVPAKYFSFVLGKGPAWWYQEEHIFRLKPRDDGKVTFYNEVFATGLALRFGRKSAAHRMRYAVDQMNEALQDRLQKPA
jgi:hypothetical protein